MKLNKNFEFDMTDIDTIEMALRRKVAELSQKLLSGKGDAEALRDEIKQMSELLARIHNQKNWYRPKTEIYVSG
tara:strand:+ start:147 stop:368 length:222 start_codon:yes stop_codon:yes gene_type:complete